jgi:hypothetical protein
VAFWKKSAQPDQPQVVEHAVSIHVSSLADDIGLDQIEDPIIDAIARSGSGRFDGNQIGPDGAVLYLYGPDADTLWATIDPAVRRDALGSGSFVVTRYGAPGAAQVRIELNDPEPSVRHRVRVYGGYDEAQWLGALDAVEGVVVAWIPGQNEHRACVVELDRPLTAEGDVGGERVTITGGHLVLEPRYVGQVWEHTGIVHVELCPSLPAPVPWSQRAVGAWVESHATYRIVT